jgi:hypothetical protein
MSARVLFKRAVFAVAMAAGLTTCAAGQFGYVYPAPFTRPTWPPSNPGFTPAPLPPLFQPYQLIPPYGSGSLFFAPGYALPPYGGVLIHPGYIPGPYGYGYYPPYGYFPYGYQYFNWRYSTPWPYPRFSPGRPYGQRMRDRPNIQNDANTPGTPSRPPQGQNGQRSNLTEPPRGQTPQGEPI